MPYALLTDDELEALLERAVHRALAVLKSTEALSTAEAARVAHRSPKTIRQWITSGRLRAFRRGRQLLIMRLDLDALLVGRPEGTSAASIITSLKK